jgi:osmotically-inducible protein OsmY
VRLSGQVASPEQRTLALETARGVAGAKDVTDALTASGQRPGGDAPRDAAEAAVRANPNLAGAEIVVARRGDRLVLSGHVRSGAERDLAGLLAGNAAGQPVDNALEVRR